MDFPLWSNARVGRLSQRWVWAVMVATMAVVKAEKETIYLLDGATPGMMQLEEFISSNTQALCMYIKCQEPFDATGCQKNSVYLSEAGQFGCCGACVTFKTNGEGNCTGSIDPANGGGYTASSWPDVLQDLNEEFLSPNNNVFSSWCDYGLKCNTSHMCEAGGQTEGGCFYVRQQYYAALNSSSYLSYRDDYRWPPSCTPQGEYAAVQRKGPPGEERYVCVDPAGNTIFGRVFPWQEQLFTDMNCMCSRQVWERQQAGESYITLHCMENGNYEALQCEDGWCHCVHPASGESYGTLIPEEAMHLLPCYNATVLGEQYLRRCESESEAHGQLMDYMMAKGVYGPADPYKCDPDGSFSGEQCIHGQCRCYDKYMFSILKLSSGGGCNCARDQWIYDNQENSHASLTCASPGGADAGLYYTYQYYGDIGVYCVDQDGVRASPMIYSKYLRLLKCEEAAMCQKGQNEACVNACYNCKSSFFVKYSEETRKKSNITSK